MARGGKREGAGRKKGAVTKATVIRQEMLARAAAAGLSPLEFMLNILRDESADFKDRFEAAKHAAPYVHPRLAAVEHSGNEDKPLGVQILTGVPANLIAHANGDDASPPKGH